MSKTDITRLNNRYLLVGKDLQAILSKVLKRKFTLVVHADIIKQEQCLEYIYTLTSKNMDIIMLRIKPTVNVVSLSYYKVDNILLTSTDLRNEYFACMMEFFTNILKKHDRNVKKHIYSRRRYGEKYVKSIKELLKIVEELQYIKECRVLQTLNNDIK